MSVVYKIKNSVPETTKCLLHPKHTSNTLPTTLEISLTYPEKRYDGYLYSTKSTTLYSPKYDHTIRSSGQLNVEYASSAFFTLVCGSKSVEGLAGGCKFNFHNIPFFLYCFLLQSPTALLLIGTCFLNQNCSRKWPLQRFLSSFFSFWKIII